MTKYVFNMLNSIKNGHQSKKGSVIVYRKNICEPFLKLLWDEGFVSGYRITPFDKTRIEIFLKYSMTGKPAIRSIKFISKPSRRIYLSAKQIWKLDSNKAFTIFSTNAGLLSIIECKKKKIGGEPLIVLN